MRIEIVTTNDKFQPYYHFHGYLWKPEGDVKAIIHVVHGMTEHMGRYDAFAEEMNKHGIAVAGYDLRGHGRNDNEYPAATFISGKNKDFGWGTVLQDIRLQIYQVAHLLPNVKYYLMGFSLGSFLVRDLMGDLPPLVEDVFLVGTGFQPQATLGLMNFITKTEAKRTPAGTMSDLTRQLAFDTYNKKFQNVRTPMDWLCSDAQEIKKYMHDQLSNKEIAADLFHEMISAMKRTCAPGAYKKVTHKPHLVLLSGMDDPVGGMVGVEKCKQYLMKEGFDVQSTCLRGARHDIFHEFESGAAFMFSKIVADYINQDLAK
jgi:alpha-beta hydrolase superfamily lysophospholipase